MSTKIKILFGLLLVAVVIWLIFTDRRSTDDVVIGSALPLSGTTSIYGQENREGMELALDEINNRGGINGRRLRIIYEDNKSDPITEVLALKKLIEIDKVPAIIQGAGTPEAMAGAPIAERARTPFLVLGVGTMKLREMGDYIFRLKLGVDKEMAELMRIMASNLKTKTAYVLYVQNDYGESVRQITEAEFPKHGGRVIGKDGFDLKETNFRPFLLKIKQLRPDVVVLGGWMKNNGFIVKQAAELGIKAQFVAPGGVVGPELTQIGGQAADGVIFALEFNLNSTSTAVQNFRRAFNKKYGKDPELFASMGYDAVKIMVGLLKKCDHNSECIKNGLYQIRGYEGGESAITFDDHGDVDKPLIDMTIKNGKYVPYK